MLTSRSCQPTLISWIKRLWDWQPPGRIDLENLPAPRAANLSYIVRTPPLQTLTSRCRSLSEDLSAQCFFPPENTLCLKWGSLRAHKWKVKENNAQPFFLANSRLQKAPHQPADVSRSRSSVLSDPTKTAQNSKPQATCPKMRFPHLCIGVKINSIVISAVVLSLLLPALFLYCCR